MKGGPVDPEWKYFALCNFSEEAARRGTYYGYVKRSPKSVVLLHMTITAAGLLSLLDQGLERKGKDWWRFHRASRQELREGGTVLYRMDNEFFMLG